MKYPLDVVHERTLAAEHATNSTADAAPDRTGCRSKLIACLLAAICISVSVSHVHAQGISVWLGAGTVNEESRIATAAAQLDLPVIPLAARPEFFWASPLESDASSALLLNGVFDFNLPGVSPYLIAGWGWHGLGESDSDQGPSVGAGLKLGFPSFGLFGQIRHHQPLDASSIAVGITF